MGKTGARILFLVVAAVPAGGCIGVGSSVGDITFSSDGKQVAYIREERMQEMVVDGKIWSRSLRLHWCSIDDPSTDSSVDIDAIGAEFGRYTRLPRLQVAWSPSSSRIGVLTPHKLIIIEPGSRGKTEIGDDRILSFAWLDDGEIAYCARRTRTGMQWRVICRMKVSSESSKTVVSFHEYPGRHLTMDYSWREYWSPCGQFVVFLEPAIGGQYHVVDVSDGTVRSFGQTDVCDQGVAWALDSSRVFCVSRKVGPEDRYEALLLDPQTGVIVDCTTGFQQTFSGCEPSVARQWTVDGKYVLVNALHVAGHLVQPDPWEVVSLGQILRPRLSVPRFSKLNPRLFHLPVPGWVGVVPTGNYGDSPVQYAVDYSGQSIRPLLKDYPRAISPDGTMVAAIGENGHVEIRTLGNWWDAGLRSGLH